MSTKYPGHRNIQWKILKISIKVLLSSFTVLYKGDCVHWSVEHAVTNLLNKPLPVTSLKPNWAPIQNMTGAKTTTVCAWVMCGIKSCDESAVRQGMMLYSKIHKDINITITGRENCFGELTSLSLGFLSLPFSISLLLCYCLVSTTPSHTDWLWWSWTDSKPTACRSTVKRQFQTSLQQ